MAAKKRQKRIDQAKRREEFVLPKYRLRRWFVMGLLACSGVALVARALEQQVFETDFLQHEGQRRHLRTVEMPAHRGMISDRRGEPLAISTPVDSVWANPRVLTPDTKNLAPLARLLGTSVDELRRLLASRSNRSFVYLKRRINPDVAQKIEDLDLKGVELQREYRRFYPAGEVFSHVIGFTNVDDQGQEGIELAYNDWLKGTPGRKLVIRDGRARAIKDVENIQQPRPGKDLVLSIDRRLQFLSYLELKKAVEHHRAKSGSAVILDVRNNEILAMVNQPAYNPNSHKKGRSSRFRNRAVTDVYEPGSTMKPFTVALALESGRYRPDTVIDTRPGYYRVGRNTIRDTHNYGVIDVSRVIQKSSNVGASKIALDLPKEDLYDYFSGLGFGKPTTTGFPGESGGQFSRPEGWAVIDQATLSFGYGLSVTPLQLARAYSVIAADGKLRPLSLLKRNETPEGDQVMNASAARAVRRMMEAVVAPGGTATKAAIEGYRVAGKTGTVKKSIAGGYSDDRHLAVFAGMAPASDPRLVMVVMIDRPGGKVYYGGLVAAPVFKRVMSEALRLLDVPPDNLPEEEIHLAESGGAK